MNTFNANIRPASSTLARNFYGTYRCYANQESWFDLGWVIALSSGRSGWKRALPVDQGFEWSLSLLGT